MQQIEEGKLQNEQFFKEDDVGGQIKTDSGNKVANKKDGKKKRNSNRKKSLGHE